MEFRHLSPTLRPRKTLLSWWLNSVLVVTAACDLKSSLIAKTAVMMGLSSSVPVSPLGPIGIVKLDSPLPFSPERPHPLLVLRIRLHTK